MPRPRHAETTTETPEENEGGYISLIKRSRKDIKPAALIPTGVWTLRCISGKVSKFHDDNEDRDFDLVTFTHEPIEAGSSVDPDEAAAVDPVTGVLVYDGKRIFTKFYIRNNNDADRAARCMDAHFDPVENGEGTTFEQDLAAMKGKFVLGEVVVNSWKDKTTGEMRSDSAVRNWARVED